MFSGKKIFKLVSFFFGIFVVSSLCVSLILLIAAILKIRSFCRFVVATSHFILVIAQNRCSTGLTRGLSCVKQMAGTRTTPFTGNSYVLNDGVEVQHLDPVSIRQNQQGRREAVEARSSILPHRDQVFHDANLTSRIQAVLTRQRNWEAAQRIQQVRFTEHEVGRLRGAHAVDMPIPVLPPREHSVVDDRMPARSRQGRPNTSIRVGATEIVVEGYASANADTRAAFVIYDSRHASNRNALLGAAAMSLSCVQPTRAVFRNRMRFAEGPNVNEHLRCVIISPDTDLGNHVAATIRTGVVAQIDAGAHEELLTRSQIVAEEHDSAAAALYTTSNCRIIQPSQRAPPVQGRFSVDFHRSMSTRLTPTGYTETLGPSRPSFQFDILPNAIEGTHPIVEEWGARTEGEPPQAPVAVSRGQAFEPVMMNNAISSVVVNGADDQRSLHSFSTSIPVGISAGTAITTFSLSTVLQGSGPLARRLALAMYCDNKIEVRVVCKLPMNSGIGLMVAYGEHMPSKTSYHLKALGAMEAHVWNPAMEACTSFDFNICSTGSWSPVWAERMGAMFVIVPTSSWSNPPKTAAGLEVQILLSPEKCASTIYRISETPSKLILNRFCGVKEIAQGRHTEPIIVELSLGSPIMMQNGYVDTLGAAILSLNNCWKGGIGIQLSRLCSPFVGGTLTCAILAGNKISTITRSSVNDVNNVKFVVPIGKTGISFVVPMELMSWHYSAEREKVTGDERRSRGLSLAIWNSDAITSSDDAKFQLAVMVTHIEDLQVEGHGYGYANTASRCQAGETEHVVRPIMSRGWHDWMYSNFDGATGEHDDIVADFNPAKDKLVATSKSWHFQSSSLMKVLDTSIWWRGRLWFKVVWFSSGQVKAADKVGSIFCTTNWDGPNSQATCRKVSSDPSGEITGFLDFHGINNGFAMMTSGLSGVSAWPRLTIRVRHHKEYSGMRIQFAPDPNFQVSGARYVEPLALTGITGGNEYQ